MLIFIIMIASVALIYTTFNINMKDKRKYIASLSSIGATKKQIIKIYLIEAAIIAIISIILGMILTFAIDYLLIKILNNLFKSIQGNILNTTLEVMADVDMQFICSSEIMGISIILVIFIVFLSSLIPIVNASKASIIEMIKKNEYKRVSKISKKVPIFISKIFKTIGELSYKNVKRSKHRYATLTISLTISIILLITITGYISNLNEYNKTEELDYNYRLFVTKSSWERDYTGEILDILNQTGLIDSMYGFNQLNALYLRIEESKINNSFKQAMDKFEKLSETLKRGEDGSIQVLSYVMILDDVEYNNYLNEVGIDNLGENECILVNYSNVSTKYYDELYLTNYVSGDIITMDIQDSSDKYMLEQFSEQFGLSGGIAENKKIDLTVKAVTNIIPKGCQQDIYGANIWLVVNKETYSKLFYETLGTEYLDVFDYYVYSSNPNMLDEIIDELNIRYNGLTRIIGKNLSTEQQANENEVAIKEILLYSFLVLIGILSIMNVFNIIISNITTRKIEFAELRAIGMSKKQMKKMLILEGLFYGATSLIIGIIISVIILYVLYINMLDTNFYKFTISIPIIVTTIISIYLVIFASIWYAKKQVDKDSISNVIKQAN